MRTSPLRKNECDREVVQHRAFCEGYRRGRLRRRQADQDSVQDPAQEDPVAQPVAPMPRLLSQPRFTERSGGNMCELWNSR